MHTFNDGNGIIELELIFLALNREDSLRALKSIEFTGIYLNELSELLALAVSMSQSRINGRYPSPSDCKVVYWSGIIADTNPPPTDHWIYSKFEIDRPPKYSIFHQPPAVFKTNDGYVINPDADNINNYIDGEKYYLDMIAGQTDEYIKVYAMGQYGVVIMGQAVYPGYNDDLHSCESIKPNFNFPLKIGCDYGVVCPAIVVSQYVNGRLLILKEFIGSYITIKELAQQALEPWLNKNCKKMAIDIIKGDPADTDNGRQQLQELGYDVDKAQTNYVDPRIGAVMELLNGLVGGKSKICLSREGCPKLREGFLGKYNYRRLKIVGEEKYKDVPDKTHPYSDIHDCLQYIALDICDVEYMKKIPEEEPGFDFDEYHHQRDRDEVTGY
jgi:hypothetical protein